MTSATGLCWLQAFRSGIADSFLSSKGGQTFPPSPVCLHKLLPQVFRWFDGVFFSTVVVPADYVIWPCLYSDLTENSFHGVLIVVRVLYFCRWLGTCFLRSKSSWQRLARSPWSCTTLAARLILTEFWLPLEVLLSTRVRHSVPARTMVFDNGFEYPTAVRRLAVEVVKGGRSKKQIVAGSIRCFQTDCVFVVRLVPFCGTFNYLSASSLSSVARLIRQICFARGGLILLCLPASLLWLGCKARQERT